MFPVNFPVFFSFGELGTLAKNNLFSGEVPFPKSMILTGRSIFRRISVPRVSDFWEARPFSGEFPFEESAFSGRLHFLRRVSWKLTRNFLKRYRNCLKCCLSPRKLLTPFDLEMGAFLTRFSTQSVTFFLVSFQETHQKNPHIVYKTMPLHVFTL